MAKFTKTFVESLEHPDKGQKLEWDSETKGFGVRLTPGSKVFIAQGIVNGKYRRVKIGPFGTWTVDNARKKAKQHLLDMANGIDPNQEKKIREVHAKTLSEVRNDYIKDRDLKPSSIHDIDKHLNNTFKKWKDRPISTISREEVKKIFREFSERSPAQANQAFRLLRALLNYAMGEYRPGGKAILFENPVKILSDTKSWNTIKPKNRRIPIEIVGKTWNFLEELRNKPIVNHSARSIIDAVTFCLLTGARWGEVQSLTWENVSLEKETWHISDPKNKNSVTMPLSSQASKLLQERPRIIDNNFVFSSNRSKTGYIGPGRFITDQISEKIEKDISPHDLRRTFRAIAGECGIELWKTKLLMNHKLNQDVTISAYTETSDLKYLQPDIQKIGDWIERQGVLAKNKVVDINTVKAAQGQAEQVA